MKISLKTYKKPAFAARKVKLNFFLSQKPFLDAFDSLLVPNVFAQSGGCFLAGTKILMADGSTIEIQDIQKGDVAMSFNTKTNSQEPEKVEKLIIHPYYRGGYYIVNDTLKVTGNHPMLDQKKKKWEQLRNFNIGDRLLGSERKEVVIKTMKKVPGIHYVYNLHLAGDSHNYFADNVLVHNGNERDHNIKR